MDKSNGKMKKSNNASTGGCRILKFLCMSPTVRSSEETKSSSGIVRNPPIASILSSSTTCDIETAPTTLHRGTDLEIASQVRNFAYNELRLATRNFSREGLLGEGGFGSVYRGWINENGGSPVKPDTGIAVAVKTLNRHGLQGHREWLAEVNFLGNLHHQNLVKLVGYCMEGDQRLIVYEFMARGSLENQLFRRSMPLPWRVRMKIALDAARGLAYLHEEAQKPVIYRDFKASNVLLDADYNAKLSDFGLARDGPEGDQTHVTTRIVGTYGYAAPEYVRTGKLNFVFRTSGHLTTKSDVYSFGVVLLEILAGRKAMDKSRPKGEHNLLAWARPYLGNCHFCRIVDPRLEGHFSKIGALRSGEIVALCLRKNAKLRPLMSEVVEMLRSLLSMREIKDADNVQAGVAANNKHVAGSLSSPRRSYASSSNITLTYKVNRNMT